MKRRYFITSAMTLAAMLAGPGMAQTTWVDVSGATGLHFVGSYGPDFGFPSPPYPPANGVFELLQRNMGNGAAVGDYDNDGDLDVYLLGQLGHANVLYRSDRMPSAATPTSSPRFSSSGVTGVRSRPTPAVRFTDVTATAGAGNTGLSRGACFAHLDDDAWLDLIVVNDTEETGLYPASAIYRNNGDANGQVTFTDVTSGSGFAPTGFLKGGLAVTDYDADGDLDIFVTHWTAESGSNNPQFAGHNRLYRNDGDLQFTDVTVAAGLGLIERDCFTPIFADFDADGDVDLFVSVDHGKDLYYRNEAGTFVNRAIEVGTIHHGNDMGVAPGDFDGDGDLDLYCTNITAENFGTGNYNTLLVNQLAESGSCVFIDQAVALGVQDTKWGWGVNFVDVNNDGRLDLYAVNGYDEFVLSFDPDNDDVVNMPADLFLRTGKGGFQLQAGSGAEIVGDSRAAIAFDYDRDGDQDVLITNVNQPAVLLENRTPRPPGGGHWLDVKLTASAPVNRDAIGARIDLTTAGTTQTRWIIGSGSYLSGVPYEAHFGLGTNTTADELKVTWPDGEQTTLTNVAVDQRVLVSR